MSAPDVITAAQDVAISLPTFDFARLGQGLADVAPLLATAIPLGIYNFTEGMTNVESAAVAGDEYNLRAILARGRRRRDRRLGAGLPVPARGLHRPPGLEGRRRPHVVLAGVRRRDRAAVLPGHVLAARRAAAAGRDRPDPALHRAADRRAGVPGGAEGALRRGGDGDHPEHRGVGDGADEQRAGRGRDDRVPGRGRGAGQRGARLPRHRAARRRRDPRRAGARVDRRVHHRQELPGRGRVLPGRARSSGSSA